MELNIKTEDKEFQLTSDKIYGVYSKIPLEKIKTKEIKWNNKIITKEELFQITSIVKSEWNQIDYIESVLEYIEFYIRENELSIKDEEKKMIDSLRIVGFDQDIIYKSVRKLSTSEKKRLQISLALLRNPEIIIVEDAFTGLDMKNKKKIEMLFLRLKEQFKKIMILETKNSNILYRYTEYIYIIKNDKIWLEGNTKEIYEKVNTLKKAGINIPDIVSFTFLAKKEKKVKIEYHKDIRDIIKDIYKHV